MKPIEAGCTAIIVNPGKDLDYDEVGKVVTVVGLVPDGVSPYSINAATVCDGKPVTSTGTFYPYARSWMVLGDVVAAKFHVDGGSDILAKGDLTLAGITGNGIVAEYRLMRIDGFEEDLEVKEKDTLLTE